MRRGDERLASLRRECELRGDREACEQLLAELYRRGMEDEYLKQLLIQAARYAMDVGDVPSLQRVLPYTVPYRPGSRSREQLSSGEAAWLEQVNRVNSALREFARVQRYEGIGGWHAQQSPAPIYDWSWLCDIVTMPNMPVPLDELSEGRYLPGLARIPGRRPVIVIRGPHKGRIDWLTARPHSDARGIGIPPMRNYNQYMRRSKLKNLPMQHQTVGFPFVGVYDYQFITLPINVFDFPGGLPIFLPPHPLPGEGEAFPEGYYAFNDPSLRR